MSEQQNTPPEEADLPVETTPPATASEVHPVTLIPMPKNLAEMSDEERLEWVTQIYDKFTRLNKQ